MLSNDLSTDLGLMALVMLFFGLYVMYYVRKLAKYCRKAVQYVMKQNKNAVTLRKMAEVDATLTDLTDAYDGLLTSHKKLRSRIGMRATREKKQNGVDSIAEETDKQKLRVAAKERGLI